MFIALIVGEDDDKVWQAFSAFAGEGCSDESKQGKKVFYSALRCCTIEVSRKFIGGIQCLPFSFRIVVGHFLGSLTNWRRNLRELNGGIIIKFGISYQRAAKTASIGYTKATYEHFHHSIRALNRIFKLRINR